MIVLLRKKAAFQAFKRFNMGERQEVFGELHAGDTLVTKANEELKAGTKVIPSVQNNK